MEYWIHIFDDTSTIKLRSMVSSCTVQVDAVNNLVADIERDASSMADDKYIVVLTSSQYFKFPATADDFIVQVKKSGSKFSSI